MGLRRRRRGACGWTRILARVPLFALVCASAAADGVSIGSDEPRLALGRHAAYLADPEHAYSIEEVRRPPLSERFVASRDAVLNFGLTRSAYWVRVALHNPSPHPLERVLVFEWPLTDSLTLYSSGPDSGDEVAHAGDLLPGPRPNRYRNPVFPLSLAPGETRDLVLRIEGADALVVPLVLATREGLSETRVREGFRFGAYYTLLLVFALYNLAFFVSVRDPSYLALVTLLLPASLWQLSLDGLAQQWLWPGWPAWGNRAPAFFGVLTCAGWAWFARSFLLTRRYAPGVDRILVAALSSTPVLAGVALYDPRWINVAALPIGAVLFGSTLVASLQVWRRGFAPGRDFLLAYAFALGCLMLYGADASFALFQSGVVQAFGLPVGFLGLFLVISVALGRRLAVLQEQGRQAEALQALKEDAERANREKSRFLASASHDLRQPLHSLGLFIGALAHKVRDPDARELVDRIQASRDAMEQMFDTVLDISKLDAGVLDTDVRSFALGELLDSLRSDFEPQAEARRLRLRVVPSGLFVRSDPVLLLRILRNLVTNALRYTERGGVLVGARRVGRGEVRIEVRDSGRGIAEEQRAEVFQEYRQVKGAGRPVTEGLGLGLAIVDRLAALLDHPIALHSTPGRGSCFSVRVPRSDPPAAAAEPVPPPRAGGELEGRVVLVVDEDPEILEGMRSMLGRWGCEVLEAGSLGEARAAAADRAVDAVVSDYDLGAGTTGIEAIAAVRELQAGPLAALLVTGDTSAERGAEARAAGLAILHKPVAPARLRAALTQLLRSAAAAVTHSAP